MLRKPERGDPKFGEFEAELEPSSGVSCCVSCKLVCESMLEDEFMSGESEMGDEERERERGEGGVSVES